ncbi:MAG TPA: PadR family transcriptional regulator [Candidatus Dormibacteraeota bacterium]|nr:PadR family transcriptional regulator [Candidatus Dormibacteraeota bacterium]
MPDTDRPASKRGTAAAQGPMRRPVEFLRAVLVLLLAEQPSYGYELSDRVRFFGIDADMPRLYRTLNALEREGLVRMRAEPSELGPDRRTYQVTRAGLTWLDDSASEVARFRMDLARFNGRHAALVEEHLAPTRREPSPLNQALNQALERLAAS